MEAIIVDDRDIIQETSAVKWIESHQVEAEQLAMDAARLLSCTEDRLEDIKKQGFFSRCWNRLTGKARKMEQANKDDLLRIQKISIQYLSILQNNCKMLAQDMVTLKNQLLGLSIKEEETRRLIIFIADRTAERFRELESKVGQIEISSNLQGWILGLEERDYDELYPNKYSRMFRVINDFYSIKNDNWSYNDIILMRKALRLVDINPKEKITLESFISSIVDEIEDIGLNNYSKSICEFNNTNIDYSHFAVDNISSPIFSSIHNLNIHYVDKIDTVKALHDVMNISMPEALKILLKRSVTNLNINLNYEFPLIEAAIEILSCLRILDKLKCKNTEQSQIDDKQSRPEPRINVNRRDENGMTPLMKASENGDVEEVKLLLEAGANVDITDGDGYTALMIASVSSDTEVLKLLLKAGASVNAESFDGNTALMMASGSGQKELVKLLIEAGADPNVKAKNEEGWTSLMLASLKGHVEIVKTLLNAGADVNARDKDGSTALIKASTEDRAEVAICLIKAGAKVNAQDKEGRTALMFACWFGYTKVAKLLLDAGADTDIEDKKGWTAFDLARDKNHEDILRLRPGSLLDMIFSKKKD